MTNKRSPETGVLQLVCRDTTTGALVRYDARPPDWSASDGPDEFTHWAIHQREVDGGIGDGNPFPAARRDGFAIYEREVSAVTFASLRGSGTSTMKLRLGYAGWTGQGRFRCDSGAAMSISTN